MQRGYGSPAVLKLTDVPEPVPGKGQVLVCVHAASIHRGDYFGLRGKPFLTRLFIGIPRPKQDYVVGYDVAGVVTAVGDGVSTLKPGDEVFGAPGGGCAEYACASEDKFAVKPQSLTFAEAAAVPVSALAALHGIRAAGQVHPGQHVLINGASGGVGTYAVQIASALGAEVTAVCSPVAIDMVTSIGADHVIDYTKQDYTTLGPQFDVILDNVANHPISQSRRALRPNGTLIPNSGEAGLRFMLKAAMASLFVAQQGRPYLSTETQKDLEALAELINEGKLRPVVGATFALADTAAAFGCLAEGHPLGKVVITVAPPTA